MRSELRFSLDGEIVSLSGIDPTLSVLDWLRYHRARTGSKEGCAEGDCGACTVVVGELISPDFDRSKSGKQDCAPEPLRGEACVASERKNGISYRAVNACILFMPMLDGKALITVESLSQGGVLHPVQQAMVELHGSQCGFCTPGIVMSLFARSIGAVGTVGVAPKDVLAGNLCRCTGYGPILAAAEANPFAEMTDGAILTSLKALQDDEPLTLAHDGRRWFAPKTTDQLAALLLEHPQARIVAGATDVGLWVTKQHRVLTDIIAVGDIVDLATITEDADGLTFGAGVRYSDAFAALARLHPDLGELVRRIGAVQVRNSGTIGGNIANGSPIGDMPPALIALGAQLTLRRGDTRRTLALEDYFIAYGQQDRQPSEFVEAVFVPRPDPRDLVRIVKLSKRFDSDISAVCAGINLRIEDGIITVARLAFGGMSGTPKRATAAESMLIGQLFSAEAMEAAAKALAQDFTPLDDVRGSSAYRLSVAGNLLRRLWFEQSGQGGTVLDQEAIHA